MAEILYEILVVITCQCTYFKRDISIFVLVAPFAKVIASDDNLILREAYLCEYSFFLVGILRWFFLSQSAKRNRSLDASWPGLFEIKSYPAFAFFYLSCACVMEPQSSSIDLFLFNKRV